MNRCVVILSLLAASARAEVVPDPMFTDHMVLQRELPVPVWGTAEAGEKVRVRFLDQDISTVADKDGRWLVKLQPLKAGGPHEFTIEGKNRVTFKDVLVGEVWLCSGQSNMAVSYGELITPDVKKAQASPASGKVRFYNISGTLLKKEERTSWTPCSFESALPFSAVGVYFGRELQKALDVPVGLINASWGSTPIQSFYAPLANPEQKLRISEGAMYKRMVAQVRPFALRGAIWYQGEANLAEAHNYRNLLPILVRSWRENWGQGDFPFLLAQQHQYGDEKLMQLTAEMAESQLVAVRGIKNAGFAVTADHGGHKHPRNKEPVGIRLALVARSLAYGEKIVHEGPRFDKAMIMDGKVRIRLTNLGGGLVVKNDKLTGFTIAGQEMKFLEGTAVLEGDEIVVSHPEIAQPAAVRYAWGTVAPMSVYNREGLPLPPSRTDSFTLISEKK